MELNHYIDHTLLKAESKQEDIQKLVEEAIYYHFASVCVNPCWVSYVADKLKGKTTKVCTVVGFPLGANTTASKVFETREAIQNGADEIDMVINIGMAKAGHFDIIESEIKAIVDAADGHLVKVIIETCLLSDDEKIKACQAAKNAGADFVKTSTGFSHRGATVEDVALMRKTVGSKMGVKASGGIHTVDEAKAMISAGANRIGTSAGVSIMEGIVSKK